ncbi:MAG: PilN domain-containing protein [Candidatus Desulforudis sp.]|nr:PilN domain-containing protein [Desulforudis sp.]
MYKVNLLPAEMITEGRKWSLTENWPGLAWRAGAALVVLVYGVFLFTLFSARGMLDERRAALAQLSSQVHAAQELQRDLEQGEALLATWREMLRGREDWVYVLEDVNAGVPGDVWFTALEIVPGAEEDSEELYPRPDRVRFEGRSSFLPGVGRLVENLYRMPHFSGVTLQEAREESDGILSFTIMAQLAGSNDDVAAAD